jgi:hypothetical protein
MFHAPWGAFLDAFACSREAPVAFSSCLSVHLSARYQLSIFVKSDTGDFYTNLSRKSKFGEKRAKISGTLREHYVSFINTGNIKSAFYD